jgi:glucose/arabinose dehydrogenase
MGIAVDPEFSDNGFLYICYSLRNADGTPGNRVSRLHVDGHNFEGETVLLDHLPGDDIHNGCPLIISPNGDYLFIGTGDGGHAGKAQDPSYLGGKILRIELDGSIPWWNPFFGSPVWSVGFRNPRGLRFRPDSDELWVTDQGYDTQDEIDLVEKRGNYGWPNCRGTAICGDIPNYHAAIAEFDHDSNIEISDLTFYKGDAFPQWNGSLLFASLKAGRLYRAEMDGDKIVRTDIVIDGEYGRLSGIAEGPDGMLYIATDNDDDAVLRVSPN